MTHLNQTEGELKALIFDVDGTLYCPASLRRKMLFRMLRAYCIQPRRGWETFREIRAYRSALEKLRFQECEDAATAQIALAAQNCRRPSELILGTVRRWMVESPLDLLPSCRRPGVVELLKTASRAGVKLAVFSDYPANRKLIALGLRGYFHVVLSAHDSAVGRFKPNPRGIQIVLERLGVSASDTVYVGDRCEVDAAAANAAGVRALIVGGAGVSLREGLARVRRFEEAAALLGLGSPNT